jgi:hypothetical protein
MNKVTPVTLPPGRFRLATRPIFTASTPMMKTMGDRRGRRFGRRCRNLATGRDDYGHPAVNQIGSQCRQSSKLPVCPAERDMHVLTLDIAGFLQTSAERGLDGRRVARRFTAQCLQYLRPER